MKINELYRRNKKPVFDLSIGTDDDIDTNLKYNCGAFALDVDRWFCPYLEEHELDELNEDDLHDDLYQFLESERDYTWEELYLQGCSRIETITCMLEQDWEFITRTCTWLKTIDKSEIAPGDRVIAYRLHMADVEKDEFNATYDTDFHFRVLIDGSWWEKTGQYPIHELGPEIDEEPWDCGGGLVYEGPIKYAKFRK